MYSLCVDWRKLLKSLWRDHPTTHCNVIMALSNQIPLIVTLQNSLLDLCPNVYRAQIAF